MKTISLLFLLIVILANHTFSQVDSRSSGFHFSFIPPLSTNGMRAAEYTNTASFSLLVGLSKNETALGFAGLGNIILKDVSGFHLAGLWNYAGGNGRGVMIGGLTNITLGNYSGFQLSGLLNKAGEFKGFQFSGLGNVSGDVNGFQFGGLFNVAKKVSGVQFAGLINIAEESDYPIGLINIIKNGEMGVSASYNDMGSIIASFRSGGRVMYGIIGAGYNHKVKKNGFTVEGGFGVHINILEWLRINNELKAGSIGMNSKKSTFYGNYALLPGFKVNNVLEFFGGPSLNYLQSDNMDDSKIFPSHSIWKKHTNSKMRQLYVGYQVGVKFLF